MMDFYFSGFIAAFIMSLAVFGYENYRYYNSFQITAEDVKYAFITAMLSWVAILYIIAYIIYEFQDSED